MPHWLHFSVERRTAEPPSWFSPLLLSLRPPGSWVGDLLLPDNAAGFHFWSPFFQQFITYPGALRGLPYRYAPRAVWTARSSGQTHSGPAGGKLGAFYNRPIQAGTVAPGDCGEVPLSWTPRKKDCVFFPEMA